VEHSRITLAGAELQVQTAKSYAMYFKDRGFEAAVREVFGRPLRISLTFGESGADSAAAPLRQPAAAQENEASDRALSNPEVQRFREVFGGEVRKVRNLKE
jgi:hypothetical protein